MARVDNLTVFLIIVIVVYTALATGISASYASVSFSGALGQGWDLDILEAFDFESTQTENISKPALFLFPNTVYYTDFTPERSVSWRNELLGDDFLYVESKGIGFPANLLWNNLKPDGVEDSGTFAGVGESYLISEYNYDKNYTYLVFNRGGQLETHVLFSPQFYYNETAEAITWIYDNMTASIDAGELTVTVGVNVTYQDAFDISKIFGQLVGFGSIYTGMPDEVNYLISGIWWTMILLLGVKLVVG